MNNVPGGPLCSDLSYDYDYDYDDDDEFEFEDEEWQPDGFYDDMADYPAPPVVEAAVLESRLALPYEYVADEYNTKVAGPRANTDPVAVGDLIVDYLKRRVTALAETTDGELGLMLSGGIDSILVAAVAHSVGVDPIAVTVTAGNHKGGDGTFAGHVAKHLGLRHEVYEMDSLSLMREAGRCVDLLGTDEVWEVLAAVPIRAAFERLGDMGCTGPVLTGNGADALFAGGKVLMSGGDNYASHEVDHHVRHDVSRNFTRNRFIPDFYERLLGDDHSRFVKMFQTTEAWLLSLDVAPSALWGQWDLWYRDKYPLRLAAERLGMPRGWAWMEKSPMQHSSGLVSGLRTAARIAMTEHAGPATYTDPMSEDDDLFTTRMALRFNAPIAANLALAAQRPGYNEMYLREADPNR